MLPRIICVVVMAVLLAQCGSDPSGSSADPTSISSIISRSPMADSTAEIAAVILSRQLVAPNNMYNRIRRDLERIQAEHGDTLSAVYLPYMPFHRPGYLTVQAPDSLMNDPDSPTRHVLDSLNDVYGAESMTNSIWEYYLLQFRGRLNSCRLVEIYSRVPGLTQVWHTGGIPGDYSCLLILPDEPGYHYFFRIGYGDCPAGCIYSHIYYFTVGGNRVFYHGDCVYSNPADSASYPAWIDSYREAWKQMEYFITWEADSGLSYYPSREWFYPTKRH